MTTKQRSPRLAAFIVFALLAAPIAAAHAAAAKNLALGRPYMLDQAPQRYSGAHGPRAFTWPAGFSNARRAGSARVGFLTWYRGSLTDGKVARGDRRGIVRFSGNTPLRVTIDLGTPSRVNSVRISAWNAGEEALAPGRIQVECGVKNDTDLKLAADLSASPATKRKHARKVGVVSFKPTFARFVRITINNNSPDPLRGLWIEEVEVIGDPPAAPSPGPSQLKRVPLKHAWWPDRVLPISLSKPTKLNLRIEWGWGPYHQNWDGSLKVDDGSIEKVYGFKLDNALFAKPDGIDRIAPHDATTCKWFSETGGDTDGVLVTMLGDNRSTVTFRGAGATIVLPLGRLLARPWRTEEFLVGADGQKVRFFVPWVFQDESRPISKVKPIFPRTVLVDKGRPLCAIVVPAQEGYKALGERVRKAILAAAGPRAARGGIALLTDAQAMQTPLRIRDDLIAKSHLILLGNLCNNRATIPMYGRGHFFADEVFPGKGGYEVRTICDPFGRGRNIITLAGIGPAEVALAANAFVKKLRSDAHSGRVFIEKTTDLRLKPLKHPSIVPEHFVWGSSNKRSPFKLTPKDAQAALENVRALLAKGDPKSAKKAFRAAFAMARLYFRSGDKGVAKRAHEAVMLATRAFAPLPHKDRLYAGMAGITGLMRNWDQIEECGFFTDEERLFVTNTLLTTCREVLYKAHRSHHSFTRLRGEKVAYDNNHGTCWARAAAEAAQYFRPYYNRPEADRWYWGVMAVNKPTELSHRQIEDAGGYGGIMPLDRWRTSLRFDDTEYMDRGVARSHADWAVMTINNLGAVCGFGDTVGFCAMNSYEIIGRAAWYYNDPSYRWIFDNVLQPIRKDTGWNEMNKYSVICSVKLGMRFPKRVNAPSKRPDHLLGLTVLPMWQDSAFGNRHGWSSTEALYDPKTPKPGYVDKLCFRESWTRDGQFMLLDGRRRGTHSQSDCNSIVSLTENGRQWVFDNDSCTRNSVSNHSSVTFSIEGRRVDAEPDALLLGAADLGDLALTRTRIPNSGTGDWDRCVLWTKGRHFLVIDRVNFRCKSQSFLVRCNWKTMGQCKLSERDLEVEQAGRKFHFKTDGSALLRLRRLDHSQYGSWRWYPFNNTPGKAWATYLEQWRIGRFAAGDRIAFTTLMYGDDPKAPAGYDAHRIDSGVTLVSGPDGAAVYGATPDGRWTDRGLDVHALLFVVDKGGFAALKGRRFQCRGSTLFMSDAPVSIRCDLARGKGVILAERPTYVSLALPKGPAKLNAKTYRAPGGRGLARMRVPAGKSLLRFTPARGQLSTLAALRSAVESMEIQAAIESPLPPLETAAESRFPAAVTDVAVAKGKLGPRIIVGLANGNALCLDPKAKTLWTKKVGAGAVRMTSVDLDGDAADEIVATASSPVVTALRLDGSTVWTYVCKGDRKGKGDRRPTSFVKAADVDRDGRQEVLVGKESTYLLEHTGKLRWKTLKIDRRSRSLVIRQASMADVTGDDKLEIVCQTTFPAQSWLMDYKARYINTKGRISHGFADTVGQSVQQLVCDADGDGKAEEYNAVVFGLIRNYPVGRPASAIKRNAATALVDVPAPARAGHARRGIVLADETGGLMWPKDHRGNKWHVQLDAQALILVSTDAVAKAPCRTAAALATGDLVVVDAARGMPLGRFSKGGSRPTAITAADLDNDGRPEFILGRKDGGIFVIRERTKM